jgi:hypothetical protein
MAEKLKRIDIVYKGTKGIWIAVQDGNILDMAIKKADRVADVAKLAKKTDGTSVRIHTRNGEIERELTYPRPADPRGTKD